MSNVAMGLLPQQYPILLEGQAPENFLYLIPVGAELENS